MRVPKREDGALTWQDQIMQVPPPPPRRIAYLVDTGALDSLKRGRQGVTVEIDLFMMPHRIREKGERPYFAYDLLLVEAQNGFVLGTQVLAPKPSLEKLSSSRGCAAV